MKTKKLLHTIAASLALLVCAGNVPEAEAKVTIKHKPVTNMLSGHRTNVSVDAKDKEHGVDVVRVYFKTPDENRYYFVAMTKAEGDTFVGTLPAAALGAGVVDYLILVKNGADEVVKSQNYTATVKDDPEALARLEEKPARDVRIETKCRGGGEQVYRQIESAQKKKKKDEETDEPTQHVWIPICSDYDDKPGIISGIDDYVTMAGVSAAEKLGVVAGIVDAQAAGSVETSGLVNGGTVAASSGTNVQAIAIGVAAVAGVAAAASSGGGGGDGGGSGGGTQLLPTITTPNGAGSQVAPLAMEFNEFNGVAVPITATYNGAPMGTGTVPAGGQLTFPQPAVGGLIRVTLTADVAGASLQFHFNSDGGLSPGPGIGHAITGSAGDFVLLQTLP